jgi:L,D-transpeptidase YcbB
MQITNRSALRVTAALMAALQLGGAVALAADGTAGTGTSGASTGGAATSAVSTSAALPAAPATAPPAAPAAPIAAAGDDATGKPRPADVLASPKAPEKKKLARAKRRLKGSPAPVQQADAPAPQPGFFDAFFGGASSAPPTPEADIPADPATTAATDQAGAADASPKGKHAKGQKSAKNTIAPAGAAPAAGGLFAEETPWASGELGRPVLSPGNIEPLKAAITRYADIVAHGGWPTVPPLQMEIGTNNEAVGVLRQRLAAEGDLTAQPSGFSGLNYYDQEVADAVKRFQDRYGLGPTGDLMDPDKLKNGTRTVAALNVSAEARLAQLKANLIRMKTSAIAKGRYVVVNIPGEQIEAVENNVVALRLNGVVGKPDRPSPLLSSNIEEVKFNPTWTLPPTVVKEDLIPKGQSLQAKGQDVLAKFGIDAYDGNGKKLDTSKINWSSQAAANLRFSEQPGKDNPLGFAKLDFASPESVYMHDTPSAKLFDKSYRAASSGCIRVEHMDRLVTWLLKDTDGWSTSRVMGMKESGESKIVRLKHSVPLHWVYITAWATEDGIVHFRRDLYGKDQAFGVSKTASAY